MRCLLRWIAALFVGLTALCARYAHHSARLRLSGRGWRMLLHRHCVVESEEYAQSASPRLTLVLVAGGPGQVGTDVWRGDVRPLLALLMPGDCVVAYDHRGTAPGTELVPRDGRDWSGGLSRDAAAYAQRHMLTAGLAADLHVLGTRLAAPGGRLVAWGVSYGALVAHTAALIPRSPFSAVVLDSPTVLGSARHAPDADALFWALCASSDACAALLPEGRRVLGDLLGAPAANACRRAADVRGTIRLVAHGAPAALPLLLSSLRDCASPRRHRRLLRRLGVLRRHESGTSGAHDSASENPAQCDQAAVDVTSTDAANRLSALDATRNTPSAAADTRAPSLIRPTVRRSVHPFPNPSFPDDVQPIAVAAQSQNQPSRHTLSAASGDFAREAELYSDRSPRLAFRRMRHSADEPDARLDVHPFANALVTCADVLQLPTPAGASAVAQCAAPRPSLVDNCASLRHYAAHVCPPILAAGLRPSVPPEREDQPLGGPEVTLLLGGLDLVTGAPPAARHYARAARAFVLRRAGHVLLPGAPCIPAVIRALRSRRWRGVAACVAHDARRPIRWATS